MLQKWLPRPLSDPGRFVIEGGLQALQGFAGPDNRRPVADRRTRRGAFSARPLKVDQAILSMHDI